MTKWVWVLAFSLAVLVRPAPCLAQDGLAPSGGAPTLSGLDLSLWPEFDRPEVLVIYRGLFAPGTSLPVPVEIRLPARVETPSAVAYLDEGGQPLNQEYTTRIEGDQLVVSFALPTLGFQLEYYDALPVDSTGKRTYSYSYTADYPITELSLEVQVPPTAEAFSIDPPADPTVSETDGLTYYRAQAGAVEQGETKSWTFTYQKADSTLTEQALASSSTSEPIAAPATEGTDAVDRSTVLVFLVAFVALIAVGAGAFWLGRRTQPIAEAPVPPAGQARRNSTDFRVQQAPRSVQEETLYCNKCGAPLRPDSDFCHKCGARVRKK